MRFYNNNGGTDWANREGWLGEDDHCSWANINCNDYRIESMSMGHNNLSGNFPTDLDDLEHLKSLDLTTRNDVLSGTVT